SRAKARSAWLGRPAAAGGQYPRRDPGCTAPARRPPRAAFAAAPPAAAPRAGIPKAHSGPSGREWEGSPCNPSARPSLEYDALTIGGRLDKPVELQAARCDRRNGLIRRQPELGSRSARLTQDLGLLAWARVPVHDRKPAARPQRRVHRVGKPGAVGNPM